MLWEDHHIFGAPLVRNNFADQEQIAPKKD